MGKISKWHNSVKNVGVLDEILNLIESVSEEFPSYSYICTKFHENILNGIRVMERIRKVNGWTDGRPDRRTDGLTLKSEGRIMVLNLCT